MTVCAIAFASACDNSENTPETPETPDTPETTVPEGFEARTFTARLYAFTKASFVNDYVQLAEGDSVAVYDGTRMNKFTVTSVDDKTSTLEGYVTEGAEEFYAVYPYEAASDEVPVNGTIKVTVPAEQKVGSHSLDMDALVAVAEADDQDHFQFRNVVSLVKVKVPEGVAKMVFAPRNASEMVAGLCEVKPGEMASSASASSVAVVPDNDSVIASGEYYVAVAAVNLADGFTVTFTNEDQEAVAESTDAIELSRSCYIDLTEETSSVKWVSFIRTADALVNFVQRTDVESTDVVRLANDIDMSGVSSWTPGTLVCTLDGAGHKIYNFKISSATSAVMFTSIASDAVLKDLVIGSKDGENYDGESSITLNATAGCSVGIAGTNNGTIQGVKNFASVNITADSKASKYFGVISSTNNGKISECANYGDVTLDGAASNTLFLGTMAGLASKSSIGIDSCVNRGNIVVNNSNAQGVAGIAGLQQGGDITSCDNYGKITVTSCTNNYSYFGGISAFVQNYWGKEAQIASCSNHGSFDIQTTNHIRGIGGIVGMLARGANASVRIKECTNDEDIILSVQPAVNTTTSLWYHAIGGIIGIVDPASGGYTGENYTENCTNSGKISFEESRSSAYSTSQQYDETDAGGIVGYAAHQLVLNSCKNSGNVSCTKFSTDHVGGIIGNAINTVKINDCENSGAVSLALDGASAVSWPGNRGGAGGICGYIRNTVEVSGCINTGAVDISGNINSMCGAGGIVAVSDATAPVLTANVNRGTVKSACRQVGKAAGGIIGITIRNMTLARNENYGDVTNACAASGDNACAAGIVGWAETYPSSGASAEGKLTSTGDIVKCNISSTGRAGGILGIINNPSPLTAILTDNKLGGTITGKNSKGATVSGVTIDASNISTYAYSYYKSGTATLTITGLSLAE